MIWKSEGESICDRDKNDVRHHLPQTELKQGANFWLQASNCYFLSRNFILQNLDEINPEYDDPLKNKFSQHKQKLFR